MKGTAFFIIALTLISSSGVAADLLSGPLVGHVGTTTARIWVETDEPADVRIDYWLEPRIQRLVSLGEPMVQGFAEARTAATPPHTGVVELTDLEPGWLVHYQIRVNGRQVRPQAPQAFSLMPPETPRADHPERIAEFTIAFASCSNPARIPIQPIWAQVAKHNPAALLLLGDNNYMASHPGAYETTADVVRYAMAGYHRSFRDVEGLRTLMATFPTYAIWDDHDFGPNNSDRTFRWREESLELFKRYWPNPSAGTAEIPGVFFNFRIADVDFFMLDDRYHRDPNEDPNRKTMLGPAQLAWLRDGLEASTATFKVIANGGTVLGERGENWAMFGEERDDFFDWMFRKGIEGVLFIAGDWHVGALHRVDRSADGYPLYELMSSNVAVTAIPVEARPRLEWGGTHYSAAPMVFDYNFGMLRFSGERGKRVAVLQVIDEHGKVRIHRRLPQTDLSMKR